MREPSHYEKLHWRIFNLGAKLVGGGFALVTVLFSVLMVAQFLGLRGSAEYPPVLLLFLIPIGVLGVLMVKARSYYPEKYKDWYEHQRRRPRR